MLYAEIVSREKLTNGHQCQADKLGTTPAALVSGGQAPPSNKHGKMALGTVTSAHHYPQSLQKKRIERTAGQLVACIPKDPERAKALPS